MKGWARLPSCSKSTSRCLTVHPPPHVWLWNSGLCVFTTLFRNICICVRKFQCRKSYFKGCLGRYLRTPAEVSSVSSTQVFLQSRKDSLARTRTGLPKRTKTTCALPGDSAGPVLPESQPVHHPHPGGRPADRDGHRPGCQIAGIPWGNYVLLCICWFSALARENFSERKSRTGLRSRNDDLVRTCYCRAVHTWPRLSAITLLTNMWWQLKRAWHSGGGDICASRTISRNLMHVTGVKLNLELRVRNT